LVQCKLSCIPRLPRLAPRAAWVRRPVRESAAGPGGCAARPRSRPPRAGPGTDAAFREAGVHRRDREGDAPPGEVGRREVTMAILRRKSELGGIYPYKVYLDRKLGWEWEFFFPACDIEDDGEGPPRFTMHDPFERIDEVLREAEKKDVPRAPVIAACALQHAMKAPGGVLWRGHDLVSSIFRPEIAIVPEPENPRYVRMT